MLFLKCSLLTGVEASAAQNLPVTKTCSQCGAVLPSSVRACPFCDSSFSVGPSSWEEFSGISSRENLAVSADPCSGGTDPSEQRLLVSRRMEQSPAWQGELSQRVEAYRTRKDRSHPGKDPHLLRDFPSRKCPRILPRKKGRPKRMSHKKDRRVRLTAIQRHTASMFLSPVSFALRTLPLR